MLEQTVLMRRRLRQLAALIVLLFACLVARLWYLQIVKGGFYRSLANQNRLRRVSSFTAPRGLIYDCHNKILARNVPQYNLAVIPDEVRRHPDSLRRLAKILNKPESELRARLQQKTDRSYAPVDIAEKLDLRTVCVVEENRCRLPGVLVRLVPVRHYPYGRLASHILGHVGEITRQELERVRGDARFSVGSVIGKTGAEKQYDWFLTGRQAVQELEVDARGRIRQRLGERRGVPGASVVLTIDRRLQAECERQLEAAGRPGAVVVLDVRNGEILAAASKPDFDPNRFSASLTPAEWERLSHDRRHPLQDRIVASRYPPGSTFKLITAAAGLQYHVIPRHRIYCGGSKKIGNREFRCWKRHGALTLREALAQSCDVYFYDIGLRVGVRRLERVMRQFGLGQKTGVDIPTEKAGIVPDPAWKKRMFHERWYIGDTANLSIGQGWLAVTPLQMARVTAAVANGGLLVTPHVVKKIITREGKTVFPRLPSPRRLGIDPAYLAVVRQGMRLAVTSRHGTARFLAGLPRHAAGKTGSAETRHGQAPHSWFVTFGPYESPRFAMACIVEQGGHGSDAAGPITQALYRFLWSGKPGPLLAARQTTRPSNR